MTDFFAKFGTSGSGDAGGTVDTIYSADGTVGSGRVATLTDTLTFSVGQVTLQGASGVDTVNVKNSSDIRYVRLYATRDGWTSAIYFARSTKTFYSRNVSSSDQTLASNVLTWGTTTNRFSTFYVNNYRGYSPFIFTSLYRMNAQSGTGVGIYFGYDGSYFLNFYLKSTYSAFKINDTGTTGAITPNTEAVFECISTTRTFVPPRMRTGELPSSPTSGMVIYDTDTSQLKLYNGTSWRVIA